MPDGMTFEKMTNMGFHNVYYEKPKETGKYEVMCKEGHIHVVNYNCKSGNWTIPSQCGWEFCWWREESEKKE